MKYSVHVDLTKGYTAKKLDQWDFVLQGSTDTEQGVEILLRDICSAIGRQDLWWMEENKDITGFARDIETSGRGAVTFVDSVSHFYDITVVELVPPDTEVRVKNPMRSSLRMADSDTIVLDVVSIEELLTGIDAVSKGWTKITDDPGEIARKINEYLELKPLFLWDHILVVYKRGLGADNDFLDDLYKVYTRQEHKRVVLRIGGVDITLQPLKERESSLRFGYDNDYPFAGQILNVTRIHEMWTEDDITDPGEIVRTLHRYLESPIPNYWDNLVVYFPGAPNGLMLATLHSATLRVGGVEIHVPQRRVSSLRTVAMTTFKVVVSASKIEFEAHFDVQGSIDTREGLRALLNEIGQHIHIPGFADLVAEQYNMEEEFPEWFRWAFPDSIPNFTTRMPFEIMYDGVEYFVEVRRDADFGVFGSLLRFSEEELLPVEYIRRWEPYEYIRRWEPDRLDQPDEEDGEWSDEITDPAEIMKILEKCTSPSSPDKGYDISWVQVYIKQSDGTVLEQDLSWLDGERLLIGGSVQFRVRDIR